MITENQFQLISKGVTMEIGALLVDLEQTVKEIGRSVINFNYLVKNGTCTDDAERYMELYKWWAAECKPRPLCKNYLNTKVIESIRPPWADWYNQETYLHALQAAVYAGFAVEVPAPVGGYKSQYYMLSPVKNNKTQ